MTGLCWVRIFRDVLQVLNAILLVAEPGFRPRGLPKSLANGTRFIRLPTTGSRKAYSTMIRLIAPLSKFIRKGREYQKDRSTIDW